MPSYALSPRDARAAQSLGAALRHAGYTAEASFAVLGSPIGNAHVQRDRPLYERRLDHRDPLQCLVALFTLSAAVTADAAETALHPLDVSGAVDAGLVRVVGSEVEPVIAVTPSRGVLLLHDPVHDAAEATGDHVTFGGPAAQTLASMTVRVPGGRTLDLGCGCGIQALYAAQHSAGVVATDVNERALRYTAMSAVVNGSTSIEPLRGSWLDPVEGECFDLIVTNPPFVLSPQVTAVYRDATDSGICGRLARQLPGHLNEGGFATMMANWPVRDGEPWDEAPLGWLESAGCDVLLLGSGIQDPLTYAAMWNRYLGRDAYGAALDEWSAFYQRQGWTGVGAGLLIMRRRAGENWSRTDDIAWQSSGDCSRQLERLFTNTTLLESTDGALSSTVLRVADDTVVRQALAARDGSVAIEQMEVQLRQGFEWTGSVDGMTLQLLTLLDGVRTARQSSDALADALSATDRDAVWATARDVLGRMLRRGFVEVA